MSTFALRGRPALSDNAITISLRIDRASRRAMRGILGDATSAARLILKQTE